MSKQMSASAEKRVLDLARKGGILRPRDLQTKGMPKDYLGGQPRDQWHENLNIVFGAIDSVSPYCLVL